MNIVPLEFSIVVVGQDCNPTILNPDFLKYRGIVPEEWGWEIAGAPITTPPFATVAYDSGITIKVETNRFQVSVQTSADDIDQRKAVQVATNYINVLPHVRYTGVGINFQSLIEMEHPDDRLAESFLKAGALNGEKSPLLGVSLKFVYPHDDGRLSLSLEGGTVVRQQGDKAEERKGVLARGNYHRDCQGYPTDELVIQHIDRAVADAEHFHTILTSLPLSASE